MYQWVRYLRSVTVTQCARRMQGLSFEIKHPLQVLELRFISMFFNQKKTKGILGDIWCRCRFVTLNVCTPRKLYLRTMAIYLLLSTVLPMSTGVSPWWVAHAGGSSYAKHS